MSFHSSAYIIDREYPWENHPFEAGPHGTLASPRRATPSRATIVSRDPARPAPSAASAHVLQSFTALFILAEKGAELRTFNSAKKVLRRQPKKVLPHSSARGTTK